MHMMHVSQSRMYVEMELVYESWAAFASMRIGE
jgi:hypothetical protein